MTLEQSWTLSRNVKWIMKVKRQQDCTRVKKYQKWTRTMVKHWKSARDKVLKCLKPFSTREGNSETEMLKTWTYKVCTPETVRKNVFLLFSCTFFVFSTFLLFPYTGLSDFPGLDSVAFIPPRCARCNNLWPYIPTLHLYNIINILLRLFSEGVMLFCMKNGDDAGRLAKYSGN